MRAYDFVARNTGRTGCARLALRSRSALRSRWARRSRCALRSRSAGGSLRSCWLLWRNCHTPSYTLEGDHYLVQNEALITEDKSNDAH